MNNNLIEVIFILDESGSMSPLKDDTIGGFDSFIEKQKKEAGECKVTTVLFNNAVYKIHDAVDINEVTSLDISYTPMGTTALLDAIGTTIDEVGIRLANTPEEERPGKVLVVITTDGYENASKEYTQDMVKRMIQLQQNTYNWTFMFLGADIDAKQVGGSYGISHSHTYTKSAGGLSSIYTVVADTTSYMRSRGVVSQDELSATIQKNLENIQ